MSPTASKADQSEEHRNRILEVAAVLLLGVATIGSAWCAYQATRWNGEEGRLSRRALDASVESSRLFGLATQAVAYDGNVAAQYVQAVADGNEQLMEFYRATLVRPEFLPILDAWEAQVRAGGAAPTNLLNDTAYLDAQLSEYRTAAVLAETFALESDEAGHTADDYILTTLVLASSLFFAGVTTSFRFRPARVALLVASMVLIAYAASRVVDLPVA